MLINLKLKKQRNDEYLQINNVLAVKDLRLMACCFALYT